MKQLKYLLYLLALVFIGFACTDDDLDADALTDLPPGIMSITPNSQVTIGEFDVLAILVDGENSPLASATLTVSDEFGNVLGTKSRDLSGTLDSIKLEAAEFNAALLGEGNYVIDLLASDVSGNEVTRTVEFSITNSLFASNHSEMWLAGSFNGWDETGTHPLVLIANNTWEIQNVDLQGEGWKLKNCLTWCDEDWGDPECDNIMNSNLSGGNSDTQCGFTGAVNIRFNDQTLEYEIRPAVEFATNLSGLYLMGDFNSFEGGDYRFSLVDDHTWVLQEVLIAPGMKFRFAEMPNFMGKNFGDADMDGIAEEFADANAVFPESEEEGYYSFTFNDATLEYSYEFVRGLNPEIGIIGSATPGGWDNDTDMVNNGDGTYTIYIGLLDGEIKFRANDEWTDDWGDDDAPSNTLEYKGGNIPVSFGLYKIDLDLNELSYSLEPITFGIIGSATPGGWDNDTDLTPDPLTPSVLKVNIDLVDGEIKFRANNEWIDDWGDDDAPSNTLEYKGANIPVMAGNYDVTVNILTFEYMLE
jgi:hypothetical protein